VSKQLNAKALEAMPALSGSLEKLLPKQLGIDHNASAVGFRASQAETTSFHQWE
jgi:hypothetical protein